MLSRKIEETIFSAIGCNQKYLLIKYQNRVCFFKSEMNSNGFMQLRQVSSSQMGILKGRRAPTSSSFPQKI